jgi:microcystin-dependent protein
MDSFTGEIRMFAGPFAPQGWALCNGQTLQIRSNMALFSLIGTKFGGDGVTTFMLPDYRNASPVGVGQSPGNSSYTLGQTAGALTATMQTGHLPPHSHTMAADTEIATTESVVGALPGGNTRGTTPAYYDTAPTADTTKAMSAQMIDSIGSGWTGVAQPFSIQQPTLAINYIISLYGNFPPHQ